MSLSNKDNIFIDVDKRTFYIHDQIDKNSMSKIIFSLLFLLDEDQNKEDKEKDYKRKPIKLYINSPGGYVRDMWTLVDIMLNSKTPIHTYSTGYAHSCGFLIFIAGKKRFITKHSVMICHQFSDGIYGTYQDIKEDIEEQDRLWRDFSEYILSQTKITKSRLEEIREKKLDWHIYSEESIGLGVATDIITEF